jgi:hypothetical protein
MKFLKACAISVGIYLLAMQAIFTSGPYYYAISGLVALGVTVWVLYAAYRVTVMTVRSRHKADAPNHDLSALGFWIGALVSTIILLIYVTLGLNNIDI